jgi:hypothetical protein
MGNCWQFGPCCAKQGYTQKMADQPLGNTGKALIFDLKISLIQGRNMKKMDLLSQSDPFCTLRIDDRPDTQQKSKFISNTIAPQWNEEFHFTVTGGEKDRPKTLNIECWDQDMGDSKDFIGRGMVPLEKGQKTVWIEIRDEKNQRSGEIQIGCKFAEYDFHNWLVRRDIGEAETILRNNDIDDQDTLKVVLRNKDAQYIKNEFAVTIGKAAKMLMAVNDPDIERFLSKARKEEERRVQGRPPLAVKPVRRRDSFDYDEYEDTDGDMNIPEEKAPRETPKIEDMRRQIYHFLRKYVNLNAKEAAGAIGRFEKLWGSLPAVYDVMRAWRNRMDDNPRIEKQKLFKTLNDFKIKWELDQQESADVQRQFADIDAGKDPSAVVKPPAPAPAPAPAAAAPGTVGGPTTVRPKETTG